jgi:hypothetical protein
VKKKINEWKKYRKESKTKGKIRDESKETNKK